VLKSRRGLEFIRREVVRRDGGDVVLDHFRATDRPAPLLVVRETVTRRRHGLPPWTLIRWHRVPRGGYGTLADMLRRP
jgi:hypothetical protein